MQLPFIIGAAALSMAVAAGIAVFRRDLDLPPLRTAIESAVVGLALATLSFVLDGRIGMFGAGMIAFLAPLAVIDARRMILPDQATGALALLGLAAAWTEGAIFEALLGAAIGFTSLWFIAWAWRRFREVEALGLGDAKLLGAIGAWVGWQGLPEVVLTGAVSTIIYMVVMRQRGEAPFGPGLALGGWHVWSIGATWAV
ncbi:MAG: A24 family peptidase [Pseudomonadota bacterium]